MINDNAVFTASTGYIYLAEPGTPGPSALDLRDFDPETFGTQSFNLKPGTTAFTVSVGGVASGEIAAKATAGEVQAELEKLSSVGAGNAVVTGDASKGFTVFFTGDLFGKSVTVTATGGATVKEAGKANGWVPSGHTAKEELPEFGYEGGEETVKGSWQKKNLRSITEDSPVDYMTLKLQQWDEDNLELYYGKNASREDGVFGVAEAGGSKVDKAILIVIQDGDFRIGFTAPKASIHRDESISLPTDDFATLPVRATFLKHPGRNLFEWIFAAV